MLTLIATLFLFTTAKTNIIDQVQTVRNGDTVTIKCDKNTDKDNKSHYSAWYKQGFGEVPEYVARIFADNSVRFASAYDDSRFTVDVKSFDFSITGTKEEDAGTYFCGKITLNAVEFGSGALLLFRDDETDPHRLSELVIKSGESVTLNCSVHPLTLNCSGEHSVYWFRHESGESHPGIIYTHGNRRDQCEKSSETGSAAGNCIYKLSRRNLSLSDAGTYFCAVAACGHILFGNQTEVHVKENNSWTVFSLVTSNIISVIVIMVLVGVLLKSHQNGASSGHPNTAKQVEDTDALNYATIRFPEMPSPSRSPRVFKHQDVYSRVNAQ